VQLVEPAWGCEHVPIVAPPSFVHRPPQHAESVEQASPFCVQNEDWPHVPPAVHEPEQHGSPPAVHGLPLVRHEVLSGVHMPLVPHVPLQHAPFSVHAWLSAVHDGWHMLEMQLDEQQSVLALQLAPVEAHAGFAHMCIAGSHVPEQQSSPVMQL
jgi:hypothetical protein